MFKLLRKIADKKLAITTGFTAAMSIFTACAEDVYGCPSMLEKPYDYYRDLSIKQYNDLVDCCGFENMSFTKKTACGDGTTTNCVAEFVNKGMCSNNNVDLKVTCCGSFEQFNAASVDDLSDSQKKEWQSCRAKVDETKACTITLTD